MRMVVTTTIRGLTHAIVDGVKLSRVKWRAKRSHFNASFFVPAAFPFARVKKASMPYAVVFIRMPTRPEISAVYLTRQHQVITMNQFWFIHIA